MAMASKQLLVLLPCLALLFVASAAAAGAAPQSTYIVHLAPDHPALSLSPARGGRNALLAPLLGLPRHLSAPRPRLVYTYARAATGVAARLTEAQAAHVAAQPGVLAVHRDEARQLHTTHTPEFLRLSSAAGLLPAASGAVSDVVVGVLDTGIYPLNRGSFKPAGDGLGPPPSSFSGGCVSAAAFNASAYCNSKLVGAKFFYKGYEAGLGHPINENLESKSPLDTEGHGTHTASTAAGSPVDGAGFYNYARGRAVGMAPTARIAAYKICWKSGCYDSDILAAFDEAVGDGVNVISLSVGSSGYASAFYEDSIAIGAFGAVKKGIVVSASAGNSGPGEYTASNIAPWILTVAASSIDREFPADAILGDGSVYGGVSLYAGDPLNSTKLPVVYAADCGSRLCGRGELDKDKVAGKIVLCERGGNARVAKGAAVQEAGGIGMILANTEESGEELIADSHLIPATMVGQKFGDKIRRYVTTDPSPTATIVFHGTVIGKSPSAPRVAAFSSRGPNYRATEILKPDVTAPGVNILAAWTGEASPTDLEIDPRRVPFNIISGTSMSCPHVSGLAALLRQAHPDWSPAAVKSALMTTAYNLDNSGEIIKDLATGSQSTPFVRGAGHVDPNSALNPGLVYDADTADYIGFLCALGYTPSQIAVFTRDGSVADCSKKPARSGDLNYPAFAAVFSSYKDSVTYHRVVSNVGGDPNAVYEAKVESPAGVDAKVTPAKLVFDEEHRSLAYEITLAVAGNPVIVDGKYSFGSVTWSDGAHNVTSPIAVTWPESAGAASM
ncbi:subtilisin-like protease SBT1.4 [Hordeum vulgare subsp. vulgare]|uniref:Subtilisin-like protease n=1 Tax=Hordeum vulgare subsp. vulgare TaxID=112509 RepID=A0A8I6YMY2_HORVV|nr:subtilisin-like protease SBT1.4 [Hordeum vulgare subsp. vulgare]